MWLPQLALGLIGLSVPATLPPQGDPSGSQPLERGVYALVVGQSAYEQDTLDRAGQAADRFAAALARTYPSVHLKRLGDSAGTHGPADQAAVRTYLNAVVPELPAGSVFVFYFAGHGVRPRYSNGRVGDLFLRLRGSGPRDFFGQAITVNEVLSVVAQTPRVNAMILLDCCYAGSSSVTEKQRLSKGLDARAFVLASSDARAQTLSGLFTEALLQASELATSEGEDCLTPHRLLEYVRGSIPEPERDYITPELWFGEGIERCFAKLNQPSCLLLFTFERIPKGSCRFGVNGTDHFYRHTKDQPYFFVQVPSGEDVEVELNIAGWKKSYTFAPDELGEDYVHTTVTGIPENRSYVALGGQASTLLHAVGFLDGYGVRPAREVFQLAGLVAAESPEVDVTPLLAQAKRYSDPLIPDGWQAQFEAGSGEPLQWLAATGRPKPETWQGFVHEYAGEVLQEPDEEDVQRFVIHLAGSEQMDDEDRVLFKALNVDAENVLEGLEDVHRHDLAASVALCSLQSDGTNEAVAAQMGYRGFLNARASGKDQLAVAFQSYLEGSTMTWEAQQAIVEIKRLSGPDIRLHFTDLVHKVDRAPPPVRERVTFSVERPGEILRSDSEVGSDDWTQVDLSYALTVSADGRSVLFSSTLDVKELEADQAYRDKTWLRMEGTDTVFTLPADDGRRIAGILGPTEGAFTEILRGERHQPVPLRAGYPPLMDLEVTVDGPGPDDHRRLSVTGRVDLELLLE